jgi:hypothetical protein
MTRSSWVRAVVLIGVVSLAAATIVEFRTQGGPYVSRPLTIVDHVSRERHAQRATILLLRELEPLIPAGNAVAVFRPKDGRAQDDHDTYLAAVGLLPRHQVLPPFTASNLTNHADLVEWVVAVSAPFDHPHYRVVAGSPDGWLYRVVR